MNPIQTCPQCKGKNVVFGIWNWGPFEPPMPKVQCWRCGCRFEVQAETLPPHVPMPRKSRVRGSS
jgi:hypothetical protein